MFGARSERHPQIEGVAAAPAADRVARRAQLHTPARPGERWFARIELRRSDGASGALERLAQTIDDWV